MTFSPSKLKYRCIAFDAVGTILHANPSVADVYCQIGNRFGAKLSTEIVRTRFRSAFGSRKFTEQTDEESEFAFWKSIVHEVLGDVSEPEKCFDELYHHFGMPSSWKVDTEFAALAKALNEAGLSIAVASNFDHRLNSVMDGHKELRFFSHRVISSEIGWRKPNVQFYERLIDIVSCSPEEILMVGDDLENDVIAAKEAGLDALHLNANNSKTGRHISICALSEIQNYVMEHE